MEKIEAKGSPKEIEKEARDVEETGELDGEGNEEKKISLEKRNKTRMKEVPGEQRREEICGEAQDE